MTTGSGMREWVTAYIGLGANLGDARAAVQDAIVAIGAMPDTVLVARSALFGSAPVDAGGPDYVNAVVSVRTRLTAPDLLAGLQALELQAGRVRPYVNAPRTLDLDLLLFGEATMQSPTLTLPHPRMWERTFVLRPLSQIAPERVTDNRLERVAMQAVWEI